MSAHLIRRQVRELAAGWRRWRPAVLGALRRAAILALVVLGLLAILWGARLSCEMNPYCPWSNFWNR